LTVLNGLSPDGLILQDLGIYHLCRRFFPELPLHASTLMTVHNSLGVKQCREMGFKRVVLAREMTLAEIKEMGKVRDIELEVFIHGALCFSMSGLCLFSSYLGGMSGLRGRCVQPCRRRYHWQSRGKKVTSGYFFSMNDLEGAPFIPDLKASGVRSVKIEGRMRSSRYVGPVVRAYRSLIDAGDNFPEVLPKAQVLLKKAMSRKTTSGYFSTPQPDHAFSPDKSGNIGVFLGKINRVQGQAGTLVLKKPLKKGDRLRLHQEGRGERKAFSLKNIRQGRRQCLSAGAGDKVEIGLPVSTAKVGDSLYKVDTGERKRDKARSSGIKPDRFRQKIENLTARRQDIHEMEKELGLQDGSDTGGSSKKAGRQTGRQKNSVSLLLKTDNLQTLKINLPRQIDGVIVVLDEDNFDRFQETRDRMKMAGRLIWALPPVIFEDRVEFYREAVNFLIDQGCTSWEISNLGQLQLFTGRANLSLSGDYRLNIMNSPGLRVLEGAGIKGQQLAIETDSDNLAKVLTNKSSIKTGLTVFGRPPLFTARPAPGFFRYGPAFISPRGEYFRLRKKWGTTLAVAEEPFSLLRSLKIKPLNRLDYGVVDLTFYRHSKKDIMQIILQNDKSKAGQKELSTFNFFAKLN
ncbi:MAG: peptidase U32 family protein, partial [Desulfobia sp.]